VGVLQTTHRGVLDWRARESSSTRTRLARIGDGKVSSLGRLGEGGSSSKGRSVAAFGKNGQGR